MENHTLDGYTVEQVDGAPEENESVKNSMLLLINKIV